jgi:hypothetical protein
MGMERWRKFFWFMLGGVSFSTIIVGGFFIIKFYNSSMQKNYIRGKVDECIECIDYYKDNIPDSYDKVIDNKEFHAEVGDTLWYSSTNEEIIHYYGE